MAKDVSPVGRRSGPDGGAGGLPPGRLGTVIRFTPGATLAGIKKLGGSGLRVASTSDFRSAPSVPNDLGDADIQYFERFGIAIVRPKSKPLGPALRKVMNENIVASTAGAALPRARCAIGAVACGRCRRARPGSADTFGYRDGTNGLIDHLPRRRTIRPGAGERAPPPRIADHKGVACRSRARASGGRPGPGFDQFHPDSPAARRQKRFARSPPTRKGTARTASAPPAGPAAGPATAWPTTRRSMPARSWATTASAPTARSLRG